MVVVDDKWYIFGFKVMFWIWMWIDFYVFWNFWVFNVISFYYEIFYLFICVVLEFLYVSVEEIFENDGGVRF